MALLVSLFAGYGAFLLFTSVALGWRGWGPKLGARPRPVADRVRDWLVQAGLEDVNAHEFAAVVAVLFGIGASIAYVIFGGTAVPLVAGALTSSFPATAYRTRRERRRAEARDAWPRIIEEIRLMTGSLGRSIPQALCDCGARVPDEMRPAFAAAHREWMISTDFARMVAVLKLRLADPTADATCETLLVAHEVGGSDLDRRLAALIEDRIQDVQGRKDARSRQAGVRFARRFVLLVPLGMAMAGLSIGNGRGAYQTATGQLGVAAGLGAIAACWVWAGHLLKLPEEERVFTGAGT